jgi:hypothetical protein
MWEIPAGATAIFVGSNKLAAWADEQLEPEAQTRLTNYLKSGRWIVDSEHVFLALRKPFNSLFGSSYVSLKALKRSAQATLLITLPILLYYYFFRWGPKFWGDHLLSSILAHIGLFFSEIGTYIWRNIPRILIAITFDFLSLLRVRYFIERLSRPNSGLWRIISLVIIDFIFVIVPFYVVWTIYLAIENLDVWSYSSIYSILWSELRNQNIDKITDNLYRYAFMKNMTSAYFYGGFAPSLWLLLFVLSVILIKLIHAVTPLLHILIRNIRFEKPLLLIGNTMGVLLAAIYIGFLGD